MRQAVWVSRRGVRYATVDNSCWSWASVKPPGVWVDQLIAFTRRPAAGAMLTTR
jgi:hypothetical protein